MRAGHGRQATGPSGQHLALVLLGAVCLAAGCLNLDLPTVPATPPAPSVTVLAPKPGDTISLTAQVSVSAASVNGISTVAVLCGGGDGGTRTAFTWVAPPYLGPVNFANCQSLTLPNPDGGFPILPVVVQALTDAGATEDVSLEVFLNATSPQLTVQYPPSALPLSPFSVQVTSNVALRSFPSVTLDGTPADSVTAVSAGPDGGTYLAYFATTPGLGTDTAPYTPGVPVPIEVLTDTDRTVRLSVSATALNGNTTEEDLGVELTRVVWDVYIPGLPAASDATDWAAQPVAYAGGLVVPLATASPPSSTSNWLPARFDRADGTFDGFDSSVLDGGYLAVGLNALGQTLFSLAEDRFSGLLLVPPPPATSPLVTTTRAGTPTPPLTAVDNLLCLQDSVTACSVETVDTLVCLDPFLKAVTATSGLVSTGPPTAGVVAGAGGRYLSPNVGLCGSSWNLADLGTGTVTLGPLQDPNLPGNCFFSALSKLLAVGDGTFVVELTSNCIAGAALPPEISILRVGADSAILGEYAGMPSTVAPEVVGVLADGRVVTLRNAPPYTVFELWTLNATTPDVQTPISGLYQASDFAAGSVLAQSSYAASDGSFAVLLNVGTATDSNYGVAIVAFGPNLRPLWLYLYPRLAKVNLSRLVSTASVGDVYLVDQANNRAVSVRVRPPPAVDAGPADAGPSDAGVPDAGSPDGGGGAGAGMYITQGNSVVVFPVGATGNTAPVRTISGDTTGLSVPIGLAMDSQGNLYVANRSGSSVTVYAPGANGNVAPLRTLTATGMGAPEGLAMAPGDDLFVSTCPNCNESPGGVIGVFHFPAGATTSDYSIQGTNTGLSAPGSIALGAGGEGAQPLYVANSFSGAVETFAPAASGNVAPTSSFNPGSDYNLQGMAFASGTFFLAIPGLGAALFPANATGTPSPSSHLLPENFTYPGGVAVDSTVSPPTVYLVDNEAGEVFIIQTAGTLPNLTIESVSLLSGTATTLVGPLDILLVK